MTGDLNLGDNVDINFGAGTDLKIFHDGNDSIIEDAGTGALEIRASISTCVTLLTLTTCLKQQKVAL